MTPKAIVFDIGNVLLHWDPDRLYAQLIPDPVQREVKMARLDLDAMNLAVDAGAPFKDSIYAHAEKFGADGDLVRAWHDRWLEMAHGLIDDSVTLLRQLRADGWPVFALSNFGKDSFALACEHYPELTEFDRLFISGELGVIKPYPEIYEILERDTNLSGAELFFTDDRADNIATARERGWQAHQFETTAGLRQALGDINVTM